ncbi:MAG: DNA helicase UvrD [Candidatus Nealsonbacteria bacterium CG_4_10_14_0_2_um_filter_35_20]|uniref:DNA helicase UvrD n=2 Tax=Candidatus Nealsoniibacteriota TaxID=1817911 RepID=A0A2M7DAN2_9BACT|nr:MAG: DNA helicase UvrD [Candidatus Nealsonbacteria bacterium CG11_big_fil_rev_8_21_14_0_20_35_11]PIV45532.1 MAG: DNA helicase UvrD [Candidatus Nealsonbacteria bacterium CG02_land_8_20_14_3_00_34_20]PIW92758.1 MAG: DNA helicase UvrD [Candidatus Nealsonbacteria bacterium CG_4_8_14_3_um_filter_34_13]PIZ90048.1 MAG: DNA helicase UvrD [Candidatus Nealsonbacteria bacterium CG_4_10_14_0_2_um_filter_35_20]
MRFIADFHLHSKYSRATSPQMDLENLDKWAKVKGIKVLGTGDFTHPEWFKNLKEKLEPAESGLFKLAPYRTGSGVGLKNTDTETRFILTTEISCIYSKKGKVRKIHNVIFAPSLGIAEKINTRLNLIGNLKADGRPILGLDAKELAKIVLNASQDCLIVPAHAMTPWFGIFGSKSGFDSVEECFEDYSKYIYALETGLSASPSMIWRIPDGREWTLISNSDAHSLANIGREANIFEGEELNYKNIIEAIKKGSKTIKKEPLKLISTIEFYPEEGKYHYDGHRECGVSLSPQESKKYNNLCPVCGRPLIIGVLNRIEQLADRPEGFKPENVISFKSLVPLQEIITESLGVKSVTKQVDNEYKSLIEKFGSEFKVLLDVPCQDLQTAALEEVAEGIIRVREGRVQIEPGYDGVYGKVRIFSEKEKKKAFGQKTLF